jgi:phage-related protein
MSDKSLDPEERKKRIEETVAFYQEKLGFLTSEFDNVIANNQGIINTVQNFSDSLLGTLYPGEDFDSADNILSKFNEEVGDWDSGTGLIGNLKTKLETLSTDIEDILDKAGYSSVEALVAAVNNFAATDINSSEYEVDTSPFASVATLADTMLTNREELVQTYSTMLEDYAKFL